MGSSKTTKRNKGQASKIHAALVVVLLWEYIERLQLSRRIALSRL
jgi:hypothetical protein